jgi:hypothetical protein
MGAKDVVLKDYFVSIQVFADLFNGVCFNGEKVVEKEAFSDEASRVIEAFADVKVSRVQKRWNDGNSISGDFKRSKRRGA